MQGLRTDGRDYPLRALKIFRASHNKLHSLDQDLFEHLDNVEILDISYNPFEVIDTPTQIAINSLAFLKVVTDLQPTSVDEYISVLNNLFLGTIYELYTT